MKTLRAHGFSQRPRFEQVVGYLERNEPLPLDQPDRKATTFVTSHFYVGGRTDELGLAKRKKARQMLKWSKCSKKPAAAAQRDDFLGGLPLRAGMASGKAHCVGG